MNFLAVSDNSESLDNLELSDNSNILNYINVINLFVQNDIDISSLDEDKINKKYSDLLDLLENLNFLLKDQSPNLVNNSKELLFTNFLGGIKHIQSIKEYLNIHKYYDKIYMFDLFLTAYLDIYKLLFEYGLDPNQKDEDGRTILIHLCRNITNHCTLVHSLMVILQFNPEKELKDYFGHNAIDYLMINCENNAIKNDRINIILNILNV